VPHQVATSGSPAVKNAFARRVISGMTEITAKARVQPANVLLSVFKYEAVDCTISSTKNPPLKENLSI
jgi:hypothetical protein